MKLRAMAAGKDQRKTMTAIEQELMSFIWAIGIKAEAASTPALVGGFLSHFLNKR
jgi:hypothetical protein